MSKTVKFLKIYLDKPWSWMATVCFFSQCFLWSTSSYPYYSCLISINPTQDFLELLFHIFAFFISTLWIRLWIVCHKMWQIRLLCLQKPWTFIWKRTAKCSASLIGTGMCLPKHLKKPLSFTIKWPLTWDKNVFHQPVLPEYFVNFTIKTGNVNKFHFEGHNDISGKIFAICYKIIGKNFENVCQNSEKINQLYLRRTLNWVSEMCNTSQCFLKTTSSICLTTYFVNQFSTKIHRIFHVTSSLQLSNPSG